MLKWVFHILLKIHLTDKQLSWVELAAIDVSSIVALITQNIQTLLSAILITVLIVLNLVKLIKELRSKD